MKKLPESHIDKTYLVTGSAGFIGFHLSKALLNMGAQVIGYDNLGDYYSVALKEDRVTILRSYDRFLFFRGDLTDWPALEDVYIRHKPQIVIHFAAQPGVRYSLENPGAYVQSNLVGFVNILECCRRYCVEHLLYASSSSVYGSNEKLPFSVEDRADHPISLYAATKKSNELMAHAYSHLFSLTATGLRFFTVYGPWGRPDMSPFIFLEAIENGKAIQVFNHGKMERDFTYIDDAVEAMILLISKSAALRPMKGAPPHKIYNIGNHRSEKLMDFIGYLEKFAGREAIKEYLPLQPGDVLSTFADIDDLIKDAGFKPRTPLSRGLSEFVAWYKGYKSDFKQAALS